MDERAMDEKAPKLDLILDSISKYEESIMQQMRRAREAQEELAQARTETAKLKEAAAQLEGMIAATQALSDELEAQLEEKRRANEGLESGCHVILNQLWQEQEMNVSAWLVRDCSQGSYKRERREGSVDMSDDKNRCEQEKKKKNDEGTEAENQNVAGVNASNDCYSHETAS